MNFLKNLFHKRAVQNNTQFLRPIILKALVEWNEKVDEKNAKTLEDFKNYSKDFARLYKEEVKELNTDKVFSPRVWEHGDFIEIDSYQGLCEEIYDAHFERPVYRIWNRSIEFISVDSIDINEYFEPREKKLSFYSFWFQRNEFALFVYWNFVVENNPEYKLSDIREAVNNTINVENEPELRDDSLPTLKKHYSFEGDSHTHFIASGYRDSKMYVDVVIDSYDNRRYVIKCTRSTVDAFLKRLTSAIPHVNLDDVKNN